MLRIVGSIVAFYAGVFLLIREICESMLKVFLKNLRGKSELFFWSREIDVIARNISISLIYHKNQVSEKVMKKTPA